MGTYSSKAQCEAEGIRMNCGMQLNATNLNRTFEWVGDVVRGEFDGDPDVAGIGIVYAFAAVALLALATSGIYLLLQLFPRGLKMTGIDHSMIPSDETSKVPEKEDWRTIWSKIFEAVILSCSDQQVFVSGAYAITLRYSQKCRISAYHYNIVSNMLLMSCATHLMSIMVVSQYWKHPPLAILRTTIVSCLYIVTAILLSNQGARTSTGVWPSTIPNKDQESYMVLRAACFIDESRALRNTMDDSFNKGGKHLAENTLRDSSPDTKIFGWNFFLLMLLWYGFALVAEIVKLWFHGTIRCCGSGRQRQTPRRRDIWKRWINFAFWFYQISGFVFSSVASVLCFRYIMRLREWMHQSGWMTTEDGVSSENNVTTFGQLVPLLLMLLTVFAVIELAGSQLAWSCFYRKKPQNPDTEIQGYAPVDAGDTSYSGHPMDKKDQVTTQVHSVPATPMTDTTHIPSQVNSPALYDPTSPRKDTRYHLPLNSPPIVPLKDARVPSHAAHASTSSTSSNASVSQPFLPPVHRVSDPYFDITPAHQQQFSPRFRQGSTPHSPSISYSRMQHTQSAADYFPAAQAPGQR